MIASVSNYGRAPVNERDASWLGRASPAAAISRSGPRNVEQVDKSYDPAVLDRLERAVAEATPL